MAEDRVTIQEAARRLGVKEDAIRKRVRRGTLRSEKAEDGRVYVWVDTAHAEAPTEEDTAHDKTQATGGGELVEVLRDEIVHLRAQLDRRDRDLDAEREANRENRRLLAAALERIPELEPATSTERPPDGPESAEPRSDRVETPPTDPESSQANKDPRRSWLRRWFGG